MDEITYVYIHLLNAPCNCWADLIDVARFKRTYAKYGRRDRFIFNRSHRD